VKKLILFLLGFLCMAFLTIYLFTAPILTPLANFLVVDDQPEPADAVIVLNTGMGIYERLMEAANLYNQKYADKIFVNGNRKNVVLRELKDMGLQQSCS